MSRVIVHISNHSEGLHKGHNAILEFAKSFPGTHVVKVVGNQRNWLHHLTTGSPFISEKKSIKMTQDIEHKGFMIEEANTSPIPEAQRVLMYQKASALVSLYRESLLIDSYAQMATAMLMGAVSSQYAAANMDDIIIRGPEVTSFFQKSVRKLCGGPNVEVFPTVIKNSTTRIREQSSLNTIPLYYHSHINRLRYMIDGARDKYKIGKNNKLVEELNDAYVLKTWKVKDILVYEGGFIPGRLEVTQFIFPTEDGSRVIEEVDFDA